MNQTRPASPHPHNHDHELCMDTALWRARARCDELGIKWTALREQVFRQIAASHKPVSAYDLIEDLAKGGKRLAPVSLYRILDVLQHAGLVHRLESRNAFFACMAAHSDGHGAITFLCEECGCVTELEASSAYAEIGETARAAHFTPRGIMIEVNGLCGECNATADKPC